MKIGLVTFHSSYNYGAVLQCYALVRTLSNLGHNVKVINIHNPKISDSYIYHFWRHRGKVILNIKEAIACLLLRKGIQREKSFYKFIHTFPLTKQYELGDNIDEDFDCLICGSDQVWNTSIIGSEYAKYYFLDFGNPSIRIAYAASAGNCKFADENKSLYGKYLSKFKKIGVREIFLQNYLKEEFKLNSTLTPDPTSLLTAEEWQEIEEPIKSLSYDYLLFYTVNGYYDYYEILLTKIASALNLPVVYIDNERSLKIKYNIKSLTEVSPGQFLWLFHNAKFIATDSFHGNMFSIIFRKAFCHLSSLNGKDERIISLHRSVGLGETRIISSYEDFVNKIIGNEPNYSNDKIASFINGGHNFFETVLISI